MKLTVGQAFDVFLERLTPLSTQRTVAARHRQSVENAIRAALPVRLFREIGSFSHGTGVRHHCDTDILVSVISDRPESSDTALRWIKDSLRARFPQTPVEVRRPAVVVNFSNGTETWEITPGFITGRGDEGVYVYDIPGAASGWIDTAPVEHLKYVNECNQREQTKGGAKKLARLAKAWKYYNSVPVSSFYLEMRAAQHVATQSTFIPVWDICQLLEKLEGHQLAGMNDPKGAAARFYACSSDVKKIEALSKLHTAATRARNALDAYNAGNSDIAFYYLNLLFGGKFPSQWG
ncbi:nucleotidyltransferase domain-containing protein [Streptosporangium sp. NBC_01469]|uniref:nucleotidyltransferase domain-containing protein n=1 Tax=Streptosporangium sp. NBC_01469 TaxID=2903898 RepID=UPI002E2A03A3|nr:nucleotidyltransferase [Streptosporangium sp. NBC_01469]